MSALSATWVRFGYGLPFAVAYLLLAMHWFGLDIPELKADFLIPSAIAALLQVVGTVLLIFLFRMRNFAVGSTYVRSEAIIAAILGTAFFGETVGLVGWVAIIISVAGAFWHWRVGLDWVDLQSFGGNRPVGGPGLRPWLVFHP
jgi:drug/metabolite transporter (DMT)-like permease